MHVDIRFDVCSIFDRDGYEVNGFGYEKLFAVFGVKCYCCYCIVLIGGFGSLY